MVSKVFSRVCKEWKALKAKHGQNGLCLYIKGAHVQKPLSVFDQKHRSEHNETIGETLGSHACGGGPVLQRWMLCSEGEM